MRYIANSGKEYFIREAVSEEWDTAMELAFRVFLKYESKEYGKKGTEQFADFVTSPRLKEMFEAGSYKLLVAVCEEKIVGIISRRSGNHISLLFVDTAFQKMGIGSSLVKELAIDTRNNSTYGRMTVNAAPYATEFYHSIGFQDMGKMTEADGMIYTPMEIKI